MLRSPTPEEWIGIGSMIGAAAIAIIAAVGRGAFKKKPDAADATTSAHDALRLQRDESQTKSSELTLKAIGELVEHLQRELERKSAELAHCAERIERLEAKVDELEARLHP